MFCKYCGKEVNDEAVVCPFCGCATGKEEVKSQEPTNAMVDAPSTGFGVLGFFFPVVGLILYCVWKNRYPMMAHSVGKGALIGAIVSAASGIFIFFIYFILILSLSGAMSASACLLLLC